jgi:hypothetical protein
VDPLSLGIDPAEPVPTGGKRLKLLRRGSRDTRHQNSAMTELAAPYARFRSRLPLGVLVTAADPPPIHFRLKAMGL